MANRFPLDPRLDPRSREEEDYQQVGPKELSGGNSRSSASGLSSMVYLLQFLLVLYAVSVGTVSLVGYTSNSTKHLQCPEACTNGEKGPMGDAATCLEDCTNGTDGTNGLNVPSFNIIPSFGQWNLNAMTEDSPPPLTFAHSPSFFPVDNAGGASTGGVFSTNNASIFSYVNDGFNVVYNGPDDGWVTVSFSIQLFKQTPYTVSSFFVAVYWENPDIAADNAVPLSAGFSFDGVSSWWSLSSSAKMQLNTGSVLQMYVALIASGNATNTIDFNYFNLLVEY